MAAPKETSPADRVGSGVSGEADRGMDGRAAFRLQCRRSIARPLDIRLRYGFVNMGEKRLRPRVNVAFDSCDEYRQWCKKNYPRYSGMWPAGESS